MNKVECPYCGSEYLVKDGNHNGLQGYRCKACKKKFSYGEYKPKDKVKVDIKVKKKSSHNNLFDLGHEWEEMVEKILRDEGKNPVTQKRLENNKIVDLMYDKTIVECKLSAGTFELLETIEKYSDYCDKLEIWSLNKCRQEKISTYISKDDVIEKMERKIGEWHNRIDEFKEKNINVEMFYYDDIIKKIKNQNTLKELNELYDKYMEIQPNGGRVIYFENKLNVNYEPFLKNIDTTLDAHRKIYINNAIIKHFSYRIQDDNISDDDENGFNTWNQINGIITLKDLKKFKIPNNYYNSSAKEEYKNCSFLELDFEYINKNKFENSEIIFDNFYITDNDGKIYKSIPGYELDNQIISNCKTTFIQRHIENILPNKMTFGKLYFKVSDDIKPKDFILNVREDDNAGIELIKIKNEDGKNHEDVNNQSNIKNKIIFIFLVLIIFIIILFICMTNFNNNTKNNSTIQEKSQDELIYEEAQTYISQEDYYKALEKLKNIQEYKDSSKIMLEMKYLLGVKEYKQGNIYASLTYFNEIPNYKNSNDYIEKCNIVEKLIGSYLNENKYIMINYDNIIYITMNNGYTDEFEYEIAFDEKEININNEETKISFNKDYSSLKYKNKIYNKVSNYIDESKIKYYAPRIGMTKEEVLKTSWGKPKSIDHGGTTASKTNKKRTNGEWDESWYYKRNGNIIFIEFKNNKVVNFSALIKGTTGGKNLSSVDGL